MGFGSFTANAIIVVLNDNLTAQAVIRPVGSSITKHYRDRDHKGTESTTTVFIWGEIGGHITGDAIHGLLMELWGLTQ